MWGGVFYMRKQREGEWGACAAIAADSAIFSRNSYEGVEYKSDSFAESATGRIHLQSEVL